VKFAYRSRLQVLTLSGYQQLPDWASWTSGLTLGTSFGLLLSGIIAVISGVVGLHGLASQTPELLITGTISGLLGSFLFSIVKPPNKHRVADIFGGFFTFSISAIISGGIIFYVTDSVEHFDTALYEATVSLTTTALSTLNTSQITPEMQFFRGSLQWAGGLVVLLLGAAIIPALGGKNEPAMQIERNEALALGNTRQTAIYTILRIYIPLSFLLWVAFAFTGIGIFDGLLLAISTVSTGGFLSGGTPFEDSATQWVAIVGMCLSGTSFVVLWRLALRKTGELRNSLELRVYFLVIALSALILFIFSHDFSYENFRASLFVACSAISTTGFPSTLSGEWIPVFTVLVLLITSIGGMSSSVSGGFTIRSLVVLMRLSIREMVRQLHPRSVSAIQIDGKSLSESTVDHAVVLQFLFVSVVAVTCIGVSITELDLFSGINAAIHSTATAGPLRSIDGSLVEVSSWTRPTRSLLMPAMILGWLAIFPVLIVAGEFVSFIKSKFRSLKRAAIKVKLNE
tara:strand:+ start:3485 stop:5023 length:1539 start_codon:yes stop_codon:yes gene_type:complete